MQLRSDFDVTEYVTPDQHEWVPSPIDGVERMMLDRDGDEVAVATSFVRFAPGASFPFHEHGGGEEFLVLDGVFADEEGAYPKLSYVRHPPGTSHTPVCPEGCVIFVKLRQFAPDDGEQIIRQLAPDHSELLFESPPERVEWVCSNGTPVVRHAEPDVTWELLVIDGEVEWEDRVLPAQSWLRIAVGENLDVSPLPGTVLYIKRRPLV